MTKTLALLAGTAIAGTLAVTAFATHPHDTASKAKPKVMEAKAGPDTIAQDTADKDTTAKDITAEDAPAWDVTDPSTWTGDTEVMEIDIDVTEGTWMSLDVSPDGQTIAFDMLGDIYTLPVSGGTATNISSGLAWDIQPRFSPDGERIAFISDRAGGDNIWTMDVDGTDPAQVTKEDFRLLNNPTWSPDGRFIAGRKHFTTSRSLGTGEIWLYSATDGGSGVQLVKKPNDSFQKELGEPIFAPDGTGIYYTANTTPGNTFIYAQDSNAEVFAVRHYNMETGDITKIVGGPGGAVRPTPSPDGKTLAFVKRVDNQSMLHLLDLESGEERMVFDHLDADMQETWAVHGLYPNMDFSPDGSTLYFWAKGQIHALDVETAEVDHIDFRVNDTRTVVKAPRPTTEVAPDTFTTHMARHLTVSPDGSRVVFNSLGKLYMSVDNGKPQRLTKLPRDVREVYPEFSRNGRDLVFTTWTDQDLSQIHTLNVRSKRITTLDLPKGHYARPSFSPDGKYVAYERGDGGGLRSSQYGREPGIYVVAREGGDAVKVTDNGSEPHFAEDNMRVFFSAFGDDKRILKSTNLLGGNERTHASGGMVQTFRVSPDGTHLAFRENYNLFVTPMLPGPQDVSTSKDGKALPVRKLSTNGATYPSWFENNRIGWSLGPNLYMTDAAEMMADEDAKANEMEDTLSITAKQDAPDTTVAITNARIVTMTDADGGVMEDATILIKGDRIEAVGRDVRIPRGATTIDADGKTVIPGLIDAHAHGPAGSDDLILNDNWNAIAHLALGVTTTFNPSSRASEIFSFKEMQRAGLVTGPRTFSTGEVIYGAKAPGFFAFINDYDDALAHVTRLDTQGAIATKNYNQPRRDQRQMVTQASRERDMLVVGEGGSLFHMDMNMVADGNTSIEHNLPQEHLYDDVIQMYSQTNVAYTPTLAVTYGGVRGEDYYYQTTDVWKHPILSKHVPPAELKARSMRRQMAPLDQYYDDRSAATSKQLMDAGVLVSIGAHGQREGLAAHWEMQTFQRGGMSPIEALRTATVNPATHLGMIDDIGTLEAGKLADLVIIDGNPLEDISQAENVEHIMQGGRVFEAKSMNEVFTGNRKRGAYPWE